MFVDEQDKLGLKTLNQEGRLFLLAVEGNHLEMSQAWFIEKIVLPFLKDNFTRFN